MVLGFEPERSASHIEGISFVAENYYAGHTAQQISISDDSGASVLGDRSTRIGLLELWLR